MDIHPLSSQTHSLSIFSSLFYLQYYYIGAFTLYCTILMICPQYILKTLFTYFLKELLLFLMNRRLHTPLLGRILTVLNLRCHNLVEMAASSSPAESSVPITQIFTVMFYITYHLWVTFMMLVKGRLFIT